MDNRVNREYREKDADVLYVYDRVCRKESKKRQLNRTYGAAGQQRASASDNGMGRSSRVYGKAFAEAQRQRAGAYAAQNGSAQAKRTGSERRRSSHAYSYRPGAAHGGEAVKSRPLKLIMDRLINLFETIEERGKRDESIAKQKAIAWKKISEYKHIVVTALILILMTALFVVLAYKLFFVIDNVSVNGTEVYSKAEIVASSGFEIGDNLYSFAAGDAEDTITFLCPYIKSADVNRTIPKSVTITLEDDTAAYYAMIWGDCVKLSSGLRVLEVVENKDSIADEGLIELVLPPVKYSVAGRVIEFSDTRKDRFIRSVLDEVSKSSLAGAGMVDAVDLSDEYDISLESGRRYLLKLGDEKDCDLKLRMAYKTMTDSKFDTLLPARIDLSEVGKAIIKPDASLDLD